METKYFCSQEQIKELLNDNFKTHTEFVMRNPCLYGDFRTALEESEPRLYEDIVDYDAAKALFQEVIVYWPRLFSTCPKQDLKYLECYLLQMNKNLTLSKSNYSQNIS